MPPAEVEVDERLVRALLREQHPDLAAGELTLVDSGWDNYIYRLGSDLAVRLPRRRIAVDPIRNEQRWLPVLAPRLPVAVPTPVRVGEPGSGYGWPWSVVPWLPGRTADLRAGGDLPVAPLADFLQALHRPAPPEAPDNPFRGGPLRDRAEVVEERIDRLGGTGAISPALAGVWEAALAAPPARQRRWVHGDLHARNILVQDARITGIIDWGDMAGGDIAADLAAAWLLFEAPAARSRLLEACAASPAAIARARGWALLVGLALVDSGEPRHVALGEATLRRLEPAAARGT